MSVETELKRIADALELISTPHKGVEQTPPLPPAVAPGAPDLLPTTSAKKPGRKKGEAPATATSVTPVPSTEVSKEDITQTLQAFLKKFPGPEGADKARVFFTEAGAKNITTLDPGKYKEVFLGLQQAMK